jgi:hypothetical protein
MVLNLEFKQTPHHALDLLYARIAKLHHFTAVDTNNMVMLFIAIRLFELGHVLPKLVLGYQVAGYKQFQCVINGGPANAVFFIFHVDIQRFHIKMIAPRINFFEYGKTLGRFPEIFIFEISLENFLNHCYGFLLGHRVVLRAKVINK